ncbi:MAG: ketopantoate reductase family protein [Prolixibacteraceae bacterium]|nr:ketopantoate reductase family protein [Prolixibacteraceae bacterium]MBN2650098.1 ketopantoate reductase family protein [Prolixibacteraceae bacterium]
MKILVIGAGAIGTVTAGILSSKKFDVELVCNNQQRVSTLNQQGLRYQLKKRKYFTNVKTYNNIEETPGSYHYVLLATKSFNMLDPARRVLDKLTQNGLIVSMQDGFCEEELSLIAGSNRLVGAMVGWGATLNTDGSATMSSAGEMIIGMLDGSDDPRLDNLQYIFNTIVPTQVVGNINEHIFSKLVINSCVTTLGAISGLNIGSLITNSKLRNIFLEIIKEAIEIANALKIEIPEYSGRINYYRLIRGNSLYHRIRKHLTIRIFGIKYRNVKSSGLQSLERGEQTEIDYLNGFLVQKSKETGIETPVNNQLVTMVHEIEEGKRPIDIANLDEIVLSRS